MTSIKATKIQAPAVQQPPKVYGLTLPISEDLPKEAELTRTGLLFEMLKGFDVIESKSVLKHREDITKKLEKLFKEWLTEMCIEMNVPEIVTDNVGGKVLPFGSSVLGVDSKGADIDAVCVGPSFLERGDFFTSFFEKLKAQKEVTNARAITKAFVPVIKLKFDGVEIDLVFAKLGRRSVPDKLNFLNDQLLRNMGTECVRSLNGYRTSAEILKLVPNVENFQLALRTIKLWAKRRNIYSNMLGFLGGISWTTLVARICQVYPNATASTLVIKFFKVYSMWEWPYTVRLQRVDDLGYGHPFWEPRLHRPDSLHLMPIITPVYPQQNSSTNVSLSTFHIIAEEIIRGHEICQEIKQNKAEWSKLFEEPDFLGKYKHCILLTASSATERQHLAWVSLVESQIRLLVKDLEMHAFLSRAHVSTKSTTEAAAQGGRSTTWMIGLLFDLRNFKSVSVNVKDNIQNFTDNIYSKAKTTGVLEEGMHVSATCISKMPNLTWREGKGGKNHVYTVFAERSVSQAVAYCGAVASSQPASKRKQTAASESPAKRIKAEAKPVPELCKAEAPPITLFKRPVMRLFLKK
ncbi:poly(A) polymerase type 3-like [Brachionichthys hirsutus]|uniref:poly(A) polymerase type 3-like n=1 Tax=Brachionichthys hirsutus TaxID=412623 RepID=UPI0036045055